MSLKMRNIIKIVMMSLIILSCFSGLALAEENNTTGDNMTGVYSGSLTNTSGNPVLMYIMNIPLAYMLLYLVLLGLVLVFKKWIFHFAFILINIMMMIDLNAANSGFGDIFILFIMLVVGFLRLYTDWSNGELE